MEEKVGIHEGQLLLDSHEVSVLALQNVAIDRGEVLREADGVVGVVFDLGDQRVQAVEQEMGIQLVLQGGIFGLRILHSTFIRERHFAWIEKELKESIPSLSENKTETYGRVSKWGAYALLARLYLNAEVYTGSARWDDCIAACNELAKGGFELDKKWNDTFRVNNDEISTEIIWSIVYDEVYAKGMGWDLRWLHYAH